MKMLDPHYQRYQHDKNFYAFINTYIYSYKFIIGIYKYSAQELSSVRRLTLVLHLSSLIFLLLFVFIVGIFYFLF